MIRHLYTAVPESPIGERFQLQNRLFQGCPTIACTHKGRLWAGWYAGGSREPSLLNYNVVMSSDDGGISWKQRFVLQGKPELKIQALDIEMFMDPLERLWVCWVQRNWNLPKGDEGHLNEFAVICENPDDSSPVFSEPRFLGEGFMRCAPTFLSDGRWLFPAYNWRHECYAYLESDDQGETFLEKKGPEKIRTSFDEGMFLEARNHQKLFFLARTNCGALARAESSDLGRSWAKAELDAALPNPSSRFWWNRLPSGRILMVENVDAKSRTHMRALLSEDDGKSWGASLLLDDRENISYPEVAVAPDGTLYVVYDRCRCTQKEILLCRITEEEILAGKLLYPQSFLARIISKAPQEPAIGSWYREAMALYDHSTIPDELLK